jgi:ABC-type hemin transport system ATPase subunit
MALRDCAVVDELLHPVMGGELADEADPGHRALQPRQCHRHHPTHYFCQSPRAIGPAVETQEIDRVIRSIVKEGMTVVLVEHDMRLVMNISDRVHVLAGGKTLAEGTPQQVRADAAVVEAYLGVHGSQEADRALH